jgi:hypothetical protein
MEITIDMNTSKENYTGSHQIIPHRSCVLKVGIENVNAINSVNNLKLANLSSVKKLRSTYVSFLGVGTK